jgi:hypothetical protein
MIEYRPPIKRQLRIGGRCGCLGGHIYIHPVYQAMPYIGQRVPYADIGDDSPERRQCIKTFECGVCPIMGLLVTPEGKRREGNEQ